MTNIKSYMNDGANYQAKCVLAVLQGSDSLIEESWNDQYKKYDADIQVGRWENCREQGYCLMLRNKHWDQLNIVFYEHRNSDQICIVAWIQNTINTPTIGTMNTEGKVFTTKWDTTKDFDYLDIRGATDFIKELLKEHWRKGLEPKPKHHRSSKQLKGESNEG